MFDLHHSSALTARRNNELSRHGYNAPSADSSRDACLRATGHEGSGASNIYDHVKGAILNDVFCQS